eukprot:scaffold14867_cov194-Skeletonema_marinoi.AAC.1
MGQVLRQRVIPCHMYLQTASDSIAGGDAGELVAEGCTLGIAHPPGYPLFTIIVYFITSLGKHYLQNLSPAYLVNASSCLFGSIASGLVAATVYEISTNLRLEDEKDQPIVRQSSSIAAGLMCAFSPLLWQYNTSAEVFALHNLFVASIVFALTKYNQQKHSLRVIVIGAYLCGLSLTNQHTAILLVVPVAAWVLFSSTIERKKLIVISFVSFVAGIICYVSLPIFEKMYPHAGSWGNVKTMRGFIHHFLRKDYGTLQLWSGGGDNTTEDMITRTLSWVADFAMHQLCHPALMLFLVLGCTRVCSPNKRNKRNVKSRTNVHSGIATGRVIIASLIFYLASFHSLSNLPLSNPLLFGVHQRFWMHPNILCFILVGVGFDTAARAMPATAAARLMPIIMVAIPLVTCTLNFEASDQSENQVFRGYASSILETLPPQSLLLINYDMTFTSVRYMQECEGLRDDVQTINLSMMTYPWFKEKQHLHQGLQFPGSHYTKGNTVAWLNGGFTFAEFLDANPDHNIYIAGRLSHEDPAYVEQYEEKPHGLVRHITRRSSSIGPVEEYRNSSLHAWQTVTKHLSPNNLPPETKYPESTWEWTVKKEFVDHLVSRSTYLLDIALRSPQTQVLPAIAEAAAWLEVATSLDENLGNSPSMKKNLGLAYMNIVRSNESHFPIVEDIFSSIHNETKQQVWVGPNDEDWKAWATKQWQRSWGEFLDMSSAREEADYQSVKQIYDTVMKSSRTRPHQK